MENSWPAAGLPEMVVQSHCYLDFISADLTVGCDDKQKAEPDHFRITFIIDFYLI